jgi:cytochrome c oxidase subunit 1
MPMFLQGLAGVSRRLYDPNQYLHGQPIQPLNVFISWCAWGLALAQIPFILNFFGSLFFGKKVDQNPWHATTLEWAAPSPPPHGNFLEPVSAYRDPYEYSIPGQKSDFWPQHMKESN